jgi:DNA-binding MarR family transcriptional regulator
MSQSSILVGMSRAPDDLARRLYDFVYAYDAAYEQAARGVDLSSAQACLLRAVAERPRTMGDLAAELLCDASNITQLVARLEKRDLVRRVPGTADRRSREVSITDAGRSLDRRMKEAFAFPRQRVSRLPATQQEALLGMLEVLTDDEAT